MDFVRTLWAVLPPAFFWGASFPLALASLAAAEQNSARLVGGVYAANTIGAVVGALAGEPVARLVDRIPARAATDDADVHPCGRGGARIRALGSPGSVLRAPLALVALAVLDGALLAGVPPVPGLLIAYGRFTRDGAGPGRRDLLFGRRAALVGGRLPAAERPSRVPQRRQDPGVERAAGHAPAADARSSDDAGADTGAVGPRHRLRRRRHGGSGQHRPARRARDHRGNRAAGSARRLEVFRRPRITTSSTTRRCASRSTTRGTSC